MNRLIKYIGADANKLVVLPSTEGLTRLVPYFGPPQDIDIGGTKIKAFVAEFDSGIKHFRYEQNHFRNQAVIYVFTYAEIAREYVIVEVFYDETKKEGVIANGQAEGTSAKGTGTNTK